jgi:hypothetical protein
MLIARSQKIDDKSQSLENSGHFCLLFSDRGLKMPVTTDTDP